MTESIYIYNNTIIQVIFTSVELPVPSLVATSEVRDICSRFIRATNPTELGYSYDELKSLDDIKVTLLPEKKGTLLNRHNEYNIESRVSY